MATATVRDRRVGAAWERHPLSAMPTSSHTAAASNTATACWAVMRCRPELDAGLEHVWQLWHDGRPALDAEPGQEAQGAIGEARGGWERGDISERAASLVFLSSCCALVRWEWVLP